MAERSCPTGDDASAIAVPIPHPHPHPSLAQPEQQVAAAAAAATGDEPTKPWCASPRATDPLPDNPADVTWQWRVWWVWAAFVRPWIRIVALLLAVGYVFCVSGNYLTLRETREFFAPGKHRHVLPDLFFDWFPAPTYGSAEYESLLQFVNGTPLALLLMMFVALVLRASIRIATEVAWAWSVALFLNSTVQVTTQVPDSTGRQPACVDPRFQEFGSWIFTRISTEFCGDMIWSGHTFHCILAVVVIRRLLEERADAATTLTVAQRRAMFAVFDVCTVAWVAAFAFCVLKIRFHYSVDVQLGVIMAALILTHKPLLAAGVALLYVPPPRPLPTAESYDAEQELAAKSLPFLRRSTTPSSAVSPAAAASAAAEEQRIRRPLTLSPAAAAQALV